MKPAATNDMHHAKLAATPKYFWDEKLFPLSRPPFYMGNNHGNGFKRVGAGFIPALKSPSFARA